MSHKRLLKKIFTEPASGNLHWRDVESLLHHLGAEFPRSHGARVTVVLNQREGQLHRPHHGGALTKQDVRHLREFLAGAGVSLSAYEAERSS
jgi:hypothetical protein